jgi:glycine cleavage system H lipoate-binding protein
VRCPFLREEQVKSCQAAPFRKSLVRAMATGTDERCTSADHLSCPAVLESREAHPAASRCPFLRESLVQFCAASPRPTYVPWSESPELRCSHDGHRYCELFLAAAGSRGPALPSSDARESETAVVSGVPMPGWLFYAENHMWLDVGDDGLCHLGVDAFLARAAGGVERLSFLTLRGEARPAVVLTIAGADLTLVFASRLPIVAANTRLRSGLERLTADPYGLGWLFTARWSGSRDPLALRAACGLRHGQAAREWMAAEAARLEAAVHEQLMRPRHGAPLPADGGRPAPGFLQALERDEVQRFFSLLFPIPDFTRRAP